MIGTPSTLAPNFSVPCGRPGVATSGGGTGSLCARSGSGAPANAAAAAALLRKVRRVTPPISRLMSFAPMRSHYSAELPADPFTTVCFLMNAGSISMPEPGPVGTTTTPFSVFNVDVLHSNGTSWLSPLNSWYGPALGIADTK